MKGLIAWIVGVALTASLVVAPKVIANENGEVHYWSSGYYPGRTVSVVGSSDRLIVEPSGRLIGVVPSGMAMVPGTRVYLVNDDPAYDLSGAGDHWFLVGDGTAFVENSWRSPAAAYARTGTVNREVVPIAAEYRQDWLAVAAGDRPVRTLTSPRSVMDVNDMAVAPASVVYMVNGPPDYDRYTYSSTRTLDNGTKYRVTKARKKATIHRRTSTARYSAVKHRTHRRAAVATTYRRHRMTPARYSYTTTRTVVREPAMVAAAPAVEIRRDELGHELFQINSSWYMKNNGDWFRSESWRGPFVHVKKGSVPREVRMSEKHESRIDMD